MAKTPEGKVKGYVRQVLDARKPTLWYFMPVPGFFGGKTLDFLGCFHGMFFTVETKRPGKLPTDFQGDLINDLNTAEGANFVITGEAEYPISPLINWLDWVDFHHLSYQGPFYEPEHLKILELTGR